MAEANPNYPHGGTKSMTQHLVEDHGQDPIWVKRANMKDRWRIHANLHREHQPSE